ncbi:MAG: choice-of-anchor tandem repeat GloVer-containing protein, partial [Thermoanaerobaculia bacterium]
MWVLVVVGTCLFAATISAQTYNVLKAFNNSDGSTPYGGLLQASDGNLYGTTVYGGASGNCAYGCGTIFKIDTNGTFTTLYSFTGGSDGANPYAGLIQATDGNLYGTTTFGGASNDGTIFKIDTSGSTFTTLHSFAGSD